MLYDLFSSFSLFLFIWFFFSVNIWISLINYKTNQYSFLCCMLSVFPSKNLWTSNNKIMGLHGFNRNCKWNLNVESNVTIGIINSGIWPDSESFRYEVFGPPPKKWKGTCAGGTNFSSLPTFMLSFLKPYMVYFQKIQKILRENLKFTKNSESKREFFTKHSQVNFIWLRLFLGLFFWV